MWISSVKTVDNSKKNCVDAALGEVEPSPGLSYATRSGVEVSTDEQAYGNRPDAETLIRRRFAATGVDLVAFCAGAYLLSHAGGMFVAAAVLLFLMRDWAEGYSPGKRIFKLAVFDSRSRRCTLKASVVRNITLVTPLLIVELALVLFSERGQRLGDLLASTVVRLRCEPVSATTTEPAEEDSATEIWDGADEEGQQDSPAQAPRADTLDSMIIDAGLPAPESLTSEAPGYATSPEQTELTAPLQVEEPPAPAIDLHTAACCIGIEGEVTLDSLDDAYWQYVERYSPDAAQDLTDDELRARCAELAAAKADLSLAVTLPADENPDRSTCLQYLNNWFVVINKCRDALS